MQLCIVNGIFRVMGVATHTANIEMIIFLFVFNSDKNEFSALAWCVLYFQMMYWLLIFKIC